MIVSIVNILLVFGLQIISTTANKLLIVAFDGFRYDYHKYYKTPNLNAMAKAGVHATNGMRAAFTTKTYPNFYTLATGLYEESHGIIDNKFYDPIFKETFSMFDREVALDPKWWFGEPVWRTAQKHLKKSCVFFWPGSEVKHGGKLPDLWRKYDSRVEYKKRMDTVVEWLFVEKCDFAMVYYNQPDNTAHKVGAFHDKVKAMVENMDSLIGYLYEKLKSTKLDQKTNVIVVSDHGMSTLKYPDKKSVIALKQYVHIKDEIQDMPMSGAIAAIVPKKGKEKIVYDKLKGKNPNMKVYRKNEIPDRLHYKNSPRIPAIVLIPNEGYIIQKYDSFSDKTYIGQHGYDNDLPAMRPIFYAQGPDFKPSTTVPLFDNVDIYPLMCKLLKIKPAPNNGTIKAFKNALK